MRKKPRMWSMRYAWKYLVAQARMLVKDLDSLEII
jgi:hypothetical protein